MAVSLLLLLLLLLLPPFPPSCGRHESAFSASARRRPYPAGPCTAGPYALPMATRSLYSRMLALTSYLRG